MLPAPTVPWVSPFAGPTSFSHASVPSWSPPLLQPLPRIYYHGGPTASRSRNGHPYASAFIQPSKVPHAALRAAQQWHPWTWLPNLSTLPTAGAEASPGKCHRVLPLLRALRVPTAQRCHPITFLLPVALQPRWTCFCSPIGFTGLAASHPYSPSPRGTSTTLSLEPAFLSSARLIFTPWRTVIQSCRALLIPHSF